MKRYSQRSVAGLWKECTCRPSGGALPPAEFTYHPGANPTALTAAPPNFVLLEVLLPHAKPAAEKEAFWAEFRAGVEARLPSIEPDIALRFVEMLGENVYFKRKAHAL